MRLDMEDGRPRPSFCGCAARRARTPVLHVDMNHPRAFTLIEFRPGSGHPHRIAQGPAKAFDRDLHHIPILHVDPVAETQAVGPEEMNVNVSRAAMSFIFEMMMFNVRQAVTHLILSGAECFRPEQVAGALDLYLHRHGLEVRVHDEFRSERAGAKF